MSHRPTGGGVVSGGVIIPVPRRPALTPVVVTPPPVIPPDPDPVILLSTQTVPPGYSIVSKTHIFNLALLKVGVTKLCNNIEMDTNPAAIAARLMWDDQRRYVLRDFPWPWATKYAALGLVAGSTTVPVNYDWVYAYRYPSDCLFLRRILWPGGRRIPPMLGALPQNPPPYRLGRDDLGRLVYTDQKDAQIEYTVEITEPNEFDPCFVQMFACRLAMEIAPGLSRIPNAVVLLNQMYEIEKSKAQRAALNEGEEDPETDSEFIRSRA